MHIVEVSGIHKSYKSTKALDDISFDVNYGEIFGFIGPDGAGKTTLFRILTTLLIPDKGNALVLGNDVVKDYKKIRKRVGYMAGRFSLYQDLTVEENLKFYATIFGTTIEENYDLIKEIYVQIEPFKKRRAGKLSGGMKQKLALCCALIHKPDLLILDEPTTGVDPVSRNEFWDMLMNLKEQGITILVSTPYMNEAALCDRVALIQNGKTLSIDTPENIINRYTKIILGVRSDNMYDLLLKLQKYKYTHSVQPFGEYLHYTDKREKPNLEELKDYLNKNGHTSSEIITTPPDIEDCFMELMEEKEHVN
ncbi:MAG: ABC transporter ATP-binding protein [Ignavibacteria bacterium]|nr:ABC transporter ATP-binding protein [Ignavibacteria bacterium]